MYRQVTGQSSGSALGASSSAASASAGPVMPWPASGAQYLLSPVPTTTAPAAAASADARMPGAEETSELVTYFVDSSHNVQVTDDLLGALETPDPDDAYTAAQSEAAYLNVSRSFSRRSERMTISISIVCLNI